MNEYFKSLFSKNPYEILEYDYYYNSDQDGDSFDETDIKLWLNEGLFKRKWMQVRDNELFETFTMMCVKHFRKSRIHF